MLMDQFPSAAVAARSYMYWQRLRTRGECPDCGGHRFVEDYRQGDTVCSDCGLVVAENVWDEHDARRSYDEDGADKSRFGAPSCDAPAGNAGVALQATVIARTQGGGGGGCGGGTSSSKAAAAALQRTQARMMAAETRTGRTLRNDLSAMESVMAGPVLNLPEVARAMCRDLYSAFASCRHHKLPKEAMQAVCVYVACRNAESGSGGRDFKTVKCAFMLTSDQHFRRANNALSEFLRRGGGGAGSPRAAAAAASLFDEQTRRQLVGGAANLSQQLRFSVDLLGSAVPQASVWRTKSLCEWMRGVLAGADHFDGKHAATVCAGIVMTACAELGLEQADEARVALCLNVTPSSVREHAASVRSKLLAVVGAAQLAEQVRKGAKPPLPRAPSATARNKAAAAAAAAAATAAKAKT
jgi:TFIIB zinc-binding